MALEDTDPEIEVDILEDTLDSLDSAAILADEAEREDAEDAETRRAALNEAGRRAREHEAYEAVWKQVVAQVDQAAGPLKPAERVRLGLENVARGLVEGRQLLERLDYERDQVRTHLVHGEARLRVLSTEARAARIPRLRQVHQMTGPKRPPRDTHASEVIDTPMDEVTRQSLVSMGLRPKPRVNTPAPAPPRSVADRALHFLFYRSPEPTRESCLESANAGVRTEKRTGT